MEESQEKRSTAAKPGDEKASGGLKGFAGRHPQLAAWAVLAVVMVVMVIWSARDVGLLPGQFAAIILATIGLAGLCVWIIGWD